jgi:predicted metal-binding membrane protein
MLRPRGAAAVTSTSNATVSRVKRSAAWVGVVRQAGSMGPMDMGDMDTADPMPSAGSLVDAAGLLAFVGAWAVMMAAMMLPSALPMILLYRTAARNQAARGNPLLPTWALVAGYLLVWVVFGVPVYIASQVVGAVVGSDLAVARWAPYGVAVVLLAAGLYQFTPLKRVCLRACQSPLGFLMRHWRAGRLGALRMGADHGAYCAGCCWALMAVLVAAGAMGLAWVLLIALVVAAEKLLPWGQWATRATGVALLGLGTLVALQPQLALMLRSQMP